MKHQHPNFSHSPSAQNELSNSSQLSLFSCPNSSMLSGFVSTFSTKKTKMCSRRKEGLHFSESHCDFIRCSNPSMAKVDSCAFVKGEKKVRRSKQKLGLGLKSVGTELKPGRTVNSLLFSLCVSCLSFSASLYLWESATEPISGKIVAPEWPVPRLHSPVIMLSEVPGISICKLYLLCWPNQLHFHQTFGSYSRLLRHRWQWCLWLMPIFNTKIENRQSSVGASVFNLASQFFTGSQESIWNTIQTNINRVNR